MDIQFFETAMSRRPGGRFPELSENFQRIFFWRNVPRTFGKSSENLPQNITVHPHKTIL
jgi:hypothetical protein